MKKFIYIILVMTVVTACSEPARTNVDDTLPDYDIVSYCQKFSGQFKKHDIEGLLNLSNSVFEDCLKEEKADYEWAELYWDLLSSKLKIHCKQAANLSESYETLKNCSWAAICFEDHENLKICEERKKPKK